MALFTFISSKLLRDIGAGQDFSFGTTYSSLSPCRNEVISIWTLNANFVPWQRRPLKLWEAQCAQKALFQCRGGKQILTCCRGQCQASRWSLRGCGWRWHFRSPLGSSGVCSHSIPARKQSNLDFTAVTFRVAMSTWLLCYYLVLAWARRL